MPLFDAYVMVDWSGGDGRRAGTQDCIWIAHGPAPGSGGAGQHRGGCGLSRAYRVLAESTLTTMLERRIVPALGAFGGADGLPFRTSCSSRRPGAGLRGSRRTVGGAGRPRPAGRLRRERGGAMKLRDQVALVTGGAKGMGRAIVLRLAGEGADCILAAREAAPLEAVANEARKLGRRAVVVPTDVRDEDAVRAMVAAALDGLGGRIDILVNCAGTTGPVETPVHEIKAEDFDEVLGINLRGTFLPTKHVVPVMLASGVARS
jgi:short chain dehydrogenase/Hydantoinase B/oxoprolinase